MNAGAVVRSALESLNDGLDQFYEQLADDVVYAPFGVVGPEACRQVDEPFFAAIPDHHRLVERMIEDGDKVYTWSRLTGTTRDGTAFEMEVNGHWVVHHSKITSISLFAHWANPFNSATA